MRDGAEGSGVLRRAFRLSLRSFPAGFRRRYARDMEDTFGQALQNSVFRGGRWAGVLFALRAFLDVVRAGFGQRVAALRPHRRPSPVPGGGGDAGVNTPGRWFVALFVGWGGEVRMAGRSLRRSPGFTLSAVTILALGVGANAAVFSALRTVYLAPLPFPESDRLVLLDITDASTNRPGPPEPMPWSYPKFGVLDAWPDRLVDPVAVYAVRTFTLTGAGDPVRVSTEVVTPDYFRVLGVAPSLGRLLLPGDDAPGFEPSALLGHALWESRYGADPGMVGRTVTLGDRTITVAGVLPPGFQGLSGAGALWVTPHTAAEITAPFLLTGGRSHWLQGVGRLRGDATLGALQEQMEQVGRAAEAGWPDTDPTVIRGGSARPLASARAHPTARASLVVLSVAAALLLAVACANLAGLFLARGVARQAEMAVRVAMGAGRWRVARAVLAETLILASLGGILGAGVAWVAIQGLVALWPSRLLSGSWNVRLVDPAGLGVDPPLLAGALGLAVLAGLVAGLAPALHATRGDPGRALRRGGRGAVGASRRRGLAGGGLVALEVALALVLVVGAGLLTRSLDHLSSVPRGIEDGPMLIFSLPEAPGGLGEKGTFREAFLSELRALPGVTAATVGCAVPLSFRCSITNVGYAGDQVWAEGSRPAVGVHMVEEDYFSTLGISALAGRVFSSADAEGAPVVAILNRTAAREFFPGEDPLGRTIAIGYEPATEEMGGATVIGVVDDVLYGRPEDGIMPDLYLSLRQTEGGTTYLLRTAGEPLSLVPAVRTLSARLAPERPLDGVRTLSTVERSAVAETRVVWLLLCAFGAVALLLAAAGVWGVVSFSVSRRTRELGLRMALGARSDEVVGLVVRQGLTGVGLGIVLGSGLALAGGRLLETLLFEVAPADPVTLLAGGAVLLLVALLAAWIPARKASALDPVRALQGE